MTGFLAGANWTIEDAITVLVGMSAFFAVIAIWSAGLAPDPMRSRIRALHRRRDAMRAGFVAPQRRERRSQKEKSVGLMRQVVKRLNLIRANSSQRIVRQLAEAGWRSKDAIVIFLFFKFVLPILVGVAAVVLIYGLDMFALSPLMKMAAAVGSVLLASLAPDLVVKNTAQKRQAAIRKGLPDALDLLVICAEAGLTVDAALMRVAKEMGAACEELADELSLTSIELGFLTNRKQAFDNLARRVDLPAMRGVVTTLVQTERYGTPLSQSLRVLAAEFRNERLMRAEEKAARLPAVLTVPLIVFILPSLFIVLIGPAVLKVLDNFVRM